MEFNIGDKVRISDGDFAGVEGEIYITADQKEEGFVYIKVNSDNIIKVPVNYIDKLYIKYFIYVVDTYSKEVSDILGIEEMKASEATNRINEIIEEKDYNRERYYVTAIPYEALKNIINIYIAFDDEIIVRDDKLKDNLLKMIIGE